MLRNLKTSDIFSMSKILKKMNLKIETDDKTQKQLGAELVLTAFENLHLAENEVNEFLASLSGMDVKEFCELPIEKTFEIITEVKKLPGIANFFKSAGQLTTQK
jgi:hypothetical protein